MQKIDFHFINQLIKFLVRPFSKLVKRELTLTEKLNKAIVEGKICKLTFIKEGTGEITEREAKALKRSKTGTVLFWDAQKEALRSFKPENLLSLDFIQ